MPTALPPSSVMPRLDVAFVQKAATGSTTTTTHLTQDCFCRVRVDVAELGTSSFEMQIRSGRLE
ncbi:unnamed protein product [Ixodes persulcatus]